MPFEISNRPLFCCYYKVEDVLNTLNPDYAEFRMKPVKLLLAKVRQNVDCDDDKKNYRRDCTS